MPRAFLLSSASVSAHRADRVSREIQRELSRLIRTEVRDPRVCGVTITRVELTSDLRDAKAWWVPLAGIDDGQRIEELSAGLSAAAPFLRRRVGDELKLRFVPGLQFHFDRGLENLVRVHDLLHDIGKDGGKG